MLLASSFYFLRVIQFPSIVHTDTASWTKAPTIRLLILVLACTDKVKVLFTCAGTDKVKAFFTVTDQIQEEIVLYNSVARHYNPIIFSL